MPPVPFTLHWSGDQVGDGECSDGVCAVHLYDGDVSVTWPRAELESRCAAMGVDIVDDEPPDDEPPEG